MFDETTGTWQFTYTPAPQERLDAFSTQEVVEQDHFTVTVSDMQNKASKRSM